MVRPVIYLISRRSDSEIMKPTSVEMIWFPSDVHCFDGQNGDERNQDVLKGMADGIHLDLRTKTGRRLCSNIYYHFLSTIHF